MCKLNNIKDKEFIIYRIVNDNYVGVTTNLHKRLLKHRSRNGFDISNVEVLETHTKLDTALFAEFLYQDLFKCKKGVRNQQGDKNPIAREVLCLKTGVKFSTIKEACEALNYNYSSVRNFIKDIDNKYLLIRI